MTLPKIKISEAFQVKLLTAFVVLVLGLTAWACKLSGFVSLGMFFFGLTKWMLLALACIAAIYFKEAPAQYITRKWNKWIVLILFLGSIEMSVIALFVCDTFTMLCIYVYFAWLFFNLWQRGRRVLRRILQKWK